MRCTACVITGNRLCFHLSEGEKAQEREGQK